MYFYDIETSKIKDLTIKKHYQRADLSIIQSLDLRSYEIHFKMLRNNTI